MKRAHVHLVLDVGLALGGLAVLWTGLLMWLVLPAGSRQAAVWGLARHDWGEIHTWIALAMVGLVLVHLALNWGWVWAVVLKLVRGQVRGVAGGWRYAAGAVALALLVAAVGGLLWAAAAVKEPDAGPPRDGRGRAAAYDAPRPAAPPVAFVVDAAARRV